MAVNYHTLSDFRVDHGTALDELLTQTLAVLMERKLITLQRVAQDGLRVRASAGAGSFRRKKKLRAYLKEARAQVARGQAAGGGSGAERAGEGRPSACGARAQETSQSGTGSPQGRRREASRRVQRGAQAQRRAARIDDRSEARKMRMANGGFSPGYNAQFATDARAASSSACA